MAFLGDTLRELCAENAVAETQTVVMRTPTTFPWGKVDFDENAPAFLSKDG